MLENEEVWIAASREIVRSVRGKRSQVAFSRRIGYRSNVAADWEGGHRFPTAEILLHAMVRVGIDLSASFDAFHAGSSPAWEQGLPSWLRALRGHASQGQIAASAGCSRHQVRRWLSGEAQPRLPQFLALVNALTGRAPDWVACFVDIDEVPTLNNQYRAARTAARLAYDHPWSAAIRMLIDSEGYRADPTDDFLARSLGVSGVELAVAIDALIHAGLASRSGEVLKPLSAFTSDARASSDDRRRLKAHWAQVAADRMHSPRADDLVSLNLAILSNADLERVRQLQRSYFRQLRSIVASSSPEESATLVLMQVLSLAPERA
jgi:transcriptional regulator with XRE-family HTH domain